MAKRKRLTPAPSGFDSDPDMAQMGLSGALEVKAFLRHGLGRDGAGSGTLPIARVVAESAAEAALAEVTEAMARARAEGRLIQALPLDAVDTGHLERDRISLDEEELGHLMTSIRDHGQRTAIEVADLGQGRYGLISGWRRIQALRRLAKDTGRDEFGSVLAVLRRPAEASDAYIAMVEENEVRQGLSYYERARIAARAVDLGVFHAEKQALQRLFSAASRARRSKIGSFLRVYRVLDDVLRFPVAIPERLGLGLARAMDTRADDLTALRAELAGGTDWTVADEQACLARFVAGKTGSDRAENTSDPKIVSGRTEIGPGVFLEVAGGFTKPVLTLSGPAVGPEFRERLEGWLETGL